jgi:hypothetical protein
VLLYANQCYIDTQLHMYAGALIISPPAPFRHCDTLTCTIQHRND